MSIVCAGGGVETVGAPPNSLITAYIVGTVGVGETCFNCSRDAAERYTLVLETPHVFEDTVICDDCLFVFREAEWLEVHDAPVQVRGGRMDAFEGCHPRPAREVDEVMRTLSNPHRRETIHFFENYKKCTTATLEELVAHLAGRSPTNTSDGLWKTLYQVHLPTLESHGWLEFDAEREIITYHGHDDAERLVRSVLDIFLS